MKWECEVGGHITIVKLSKRGAVGACDCGKKIPVGGMRGRGARRSEREWSEREWNEIEWNEREWNEREENEMSERSESE